MAARDLKQTATCANSLIFCEDTEEFETQLYQMTLKMLSSCFGAEVFIHFIHFRALQKTFSSIPLYPV